MTARTIIENERHENLRVFEETFTTLEGVSEEHVVNLRRARSTQGTRQPFPQAGDYLAQAAYVAAALRGLAEAVAVLQQGAAKAKKAS